MCDSCDPGLHFLAKALTEDLDLSEIDAPPEPQVSSEEPLQTTIFFNGPIITMEYDAFSPVEAMAIQGSTILAVGTLPHVQSEAVTGALMHDLRGKCILPGFVEPHLHLILSALAERFLGNFSPPSLGNDGIGRLEEAKKLVETISSDPEHRGNPELWVAGYGYDPSRVENHPDLVRDYLDAWSPNNPVFIINQSGHLAYVNSRALKLANIDEDTKDPNYYRDPKTGKLNGIIAETAVFTIGSLVKLPPTCKLASLCRDTLNTWASKGCTTIFDAGIGSVRLKQDENILASVTSVPIPVRFYGALAIQIAVTTALPPITFGKVKVQTIKYWGDGSTQGITAALNSPYLNRGDEKGQPSYPSDDALYKAMEPLFRNGWHLMIHANGDAAIGQALRVYKSLFEAFPQRDKSIVHRIEHFTVTENDDLIKTAAELGIGISHTILHVFYWGHTFDKWVLGPPRAQRIDPVREEVEAGALVSFHSDSPVSEVNPLLYVRTAVTRLMFGRDDEEPLGKDQCVDLLQALRGVTINPAKQIKMDQDIGTLKKGKFADFVILDRDPRSTPGPELDKINVVQTWMGGKRVWPA